MATDDLSPPAPVPSTESRGSEPSPIGRRTSGTSSQFPKWVPPAPEKLTELLPQYRVERLIGQGGMGAVYQAVQLVLERSVAIKLLPAEFASDVEFITRFEREARTLAKLPHPGIVAIYDLGQTSEGHLYFVMEYVDGADLAQLIRSGKVNAAQALDLTVQICEALHHAHRQGVIHRDIKPANILVTGDQRAKLADFGLARPMNDESGTMPMSKLARGTPDYMAPEQREGHADHRADIYSLGVLLYEMLTGKRPKGIFDPPSARAAVDERIDEVVSKALQQEPERRYQEVGEMKTAVERIRTAPPGEAHRSDPARPRPWPNMTPPPGPLPSEATPPLPRDSRWGLWPVVVEAPLIGVLIGSALYFTDDASGRYDYASAFHIPTYIFLLCLMATYFGAAAGMQAYFRDAATGFRTAGSNPRRFVLRSCGQVAGLVAIQTGLLVLVGNSILEIRGMLSAYFWFAFLTAFCAATIGFLAASLVKSREGGVRILLLLILAQLIFGGALIKDHEMNRNLDLTYSFRRWLTRHPEATAAGTRDDSALRVPWVAHLTPAYYGYEAMVVAQAKWNPLTRRQGRIQEQIDFLVAKKNRTAAEAGRLEDLKDTLGLLSGLEAPNIHEVERRLQRVDEIIDGKALDPGLLKSTRTGVTAERLYKNHRVTDLVDKAEMNQNDHRRERAINVFFSPEKRYGPLGYYSFHWEAPHLRREEVTWRISIYTSATVNLLACSAIALFLFYLNLRFRIPPFFRGTAMSVRLRAWVVRSIKIPSFPGFHHPS